MAVLFEPLLEREIEDRVRSTQERREGPSRERPRDPFGDVYGAFPRLKKEEKSD